MDESTRNILRRVREVHRTFAFWYYLVVSLVWVAVQTGLLVLLVPRMKDIYAEFDSTLPSATTAIFHVSDWMTSSHFGLPIDGWTFAAPLAALVIVMTMLALRRSAILLTLIPLLAIGSLIAQFFLLMAPLYHLTDTLGQ